MGGGMIKLIIYAPVWIRNTAIATEILISNANIHTPRWTDIRGLERRLSVSLPPTSGTGWQSVISRDDPDIKVPGYPDLMLCRILGVRLGYWHIFPNLPFKVSLSNASVKRKARYIMTVFLSQWTIIIFLLVSRRISGPSLVPILIVMAERILLRIWLILY